MDPLYVPTMRAGEVFAAGAPTEFAPCPVGDTPSSPGLWSSFRSYPDNIPILQHVQVIPAPGVAERVIAADLIAKAAPRQISWGETVLMAIFILTATLAAIAVLVWVLR